MPFFIRHLTTSAPVFFMRLASSPTPISSGIFTVRGVFLAISSWRRRIFSASSCLRLLPKFWPRFLPPRFWNFCLPVCMRLALSGARSSRRWSYFSRFTPPPLRVSTIFFSGVRLWGLCSTALAGSFSPCLAGAACWAWLPWALAAGAAGFFSW